VRKAWAVKFLKKTHASYDKQADKLWKHIEFKLRDLMWLNIKDFKMLKTLVNRFVPKYKGP
jgi:hypothetical protein